MKKRFSYKTNKVSKLKQLIEEIDYYRKYKDLKIQENKDHLKYLIGERDKEIENVDSKRIERLYNTTDKYLINS